MIIKIQISWFLETFGLCMRLFFLLSDHLRWHRFFSSSPHVFVLHRPLMNFFTFFILRERKIKFYLSSEHVESVDLSSCSSAVQFVKEFGLNVMYCMIIRIKSGVQGEYYMNSWHDRIQRCSSDLIRWLHNSAWI